MVMDKKEPMILSVRVGIKELIKEEEGIWKQGRSGQTRGQ